MAKKRYPNSKKTTSGTGPKDEPVKAIIVLFTLESLKKICKDTRTTLMCYGDVALADTKAIDKILTALALGKTSVTI